MKRILTCLLVCLLVTVSAQIVALDTLQFGITQLDTLIDDTIACYPHKCPVVACHSWQLPAWFDGVVDISGDPIGVYEILIVTTSNAVRYDSCHSLFPFAGMDARLFYNYGADAQVVVCGSEGAVIFMTAKGDTTTMHHALPQAFILLDTLCPTLPIQDDLSECKSFQYIDLLNLKQHTTDDQNTLPRGIYWQWCGTVANGKKIAIFGH